MTVVSDIMARAHSDAIFHVGDPPPRGRRTGQAPYAILLEGIRETNISVDVDQIDVTDLGGSHESLPGPMRVESAVHATRMAMIFDVDRASMVRALLEPETDLGAPVVARILSTMSVGARERWLHALAEAIKQHWPQVQTEGNHAMSALVMALEGYEGAQEKIR